MKKELLIPCAIALLVGFMFSWILKPKELPNTKEYELQTKIIELKNKAEIRAIEDKYTAKYREFRNSDSTVRSSILNDLGY